MSRDVLLLRESDIRDLLDPAACLDAVQKALAAYSTGQAQIPSVIALDVAENHGEIHVKAGHLRDGPYYAVKIISGFWDNPQLGLPALNGMVVVFDAKTGAPAGFLVDNGFITDLRTGAAGAVAAKYLARKNIGTVAVVGSGAQARRQVEMLARVRKFSALRIWGRDPSRAQACADALGNNTAIPACPFAVADSVRQAVEDADLVITVTASCTPLVRAEWLKPGVTGLRSSPSVPTDPANRSSIVECWNGPIRSWRIVCPSVYGSGKFIMPSGLARSPKKRPVNLARSSPG
jgi:ornithine cyclodeaminase/alanine dehydrogenase-like protein (mu-crystallin family)